MTNHLPLVLASSSPFRKEILERLGLSFSVSSPDIDERAGDNELASDLVRRLSLEKARAVAQDYPSHLVIGSDQVAEQGGEIVGKPADHAEAVRQLRRASGNTSVLYSGIAVVNSASGREYCDIAEVKVRCRTLNDQQIDRYLHADRPYNCCGSIKVESLGISLLASIESDDPNAITGLPVIKLLRMLAAEGVSLP